VRYLLGIVVALVAGVAFNVGILIQKAAVDRARKDTPLIRGLLKSPIWIAGFLVQFALGTPLYLLSVGFIGPAVVPGLMAIGLIVLALGAVLFQHERLSKKEMLGFAFIVAGVAAFGFTRLSIDVQSFSMKDPGLLTRTAILALLLVCGAIACGLAAARLLRSEGRHHATGAATALYAVQGGLWYNAANLCLGFITAGFVRFGAGNADLGEIAIFFAAVALAAAGGASGVAATQHALAYGRVAVAIPLQNAVAQILPVCVFFFVYRPYSPTAWSFGFLAAAAGLLVAGLILLTNRLVPLKTSTGEPT